MTHSSRCMISDTANLGACIWHFELGYLYYYVPVPGRSYGPTNMTVHVVLRSLSFRDVVAPPAGRRESQFRQSSSRVLFIKSTTNLANNIR